MTTFESLEPNTLIQNKIIDNEVLGSSLGLGSKWSVTWFIVLAFEEVVLYLTMLLMKHLISCNEVLIWIKALN